MFVASIFLTLIRTTLVFALVSVLAFGSLAGAASAAAGDHHAPTVTTETGHDNAAAVPVTCVSIGDIASHDMGDGSCCVGTCTTILGVVPVLQIPARRISEIETFDRPILARATSIEFLRPPSLTI